VIDNVATQIIKNPFRPGAGHMPPYLAGRDKETKEFEKLLTQDPVMSNLIISGLRGIGKTVLLESLKSLAIDRTWLWAGTDCSEAASVSEDTMVTRLLTDIALITSGIKVAEIPVRGIGFEANVTNREAFLDYSFLRWFFDQTPGLTSDKLKSTLEMVWNNVKDKNYKGIVFAYDEAQTLDDQKNTHQYPLSLLLDVFQSLQKRNYPFLLVLTGLPSLLANLVETRTYSERLFRVLMLEKLNESESRDAIIKPIEKENHPLMFDESSINLIITQSGGYPYFIQYICKEVYDLFLQQLSKGQLTSVPMDAILRKLDSDFFAGRWAKTTAREKELLVMIAQMHAERFQVHEIYKESQKADTGFGRSQISQLFGKLISKGLLYKDNDGKYLFAVPLLEDYINRSLSKNI